MLQKFVYKFLCGYVFNFLLADFLGIVGLYSNFMINILKNFQTDFLLYFFKFLTFVHRSFFFKVYFLVRKIGPELTSVANLPVHSLPSKLQYIVVYPSCKSFYFFYVECHHSMAWWAALRCAPRIRTGESQAAKAEHV